MASLRRELIELDARIDEALDDTLLEALFYERISINRRISAVILQAKAEQAACQEKGECG